MHSLRLPLAAAYVFLTTTASAEEERLRLVWSAPPGCPSEETVLRAALRNGEPLERSGQEAPLEAEAHVDESLDAAGEPRFRVVLRARRGKASGQRVIEATTCQGVAEATAVVLSLALVSPASAPIIGGEAAFADSGESAGDFPLLQTPADTADRTTSVPEATAPSVPPVESDTEPTRQPAQPVASPALALGAHVATDGATLPFWAVGGSLTLAWTPGRARLEFDARRWAAQSQTIADSPAGARFSMTSLGARGCFALWRQSPFELSPCGGVDMHLVPARGYGADSNYDVTARWATVAGGALGRGFLTPWLAMRIRMEAFVPLARPTFIVERVGDVHQTPTLGFAASFGAEVLFF